MSEELEALEIENEVLDVGSDSTLYNALSLYQNKRYSQALNTLMIDLETDKTGIYASLIGNCYQKLGSLNDATTVVCRCHGKGLGSVCVTATCQVIAYLFARSLIRFVQGWSESKSFTYKDCRCGGC